MTAGTWDQAMRQLASAVQDLLRGDGHAYRNQWSHGDDVTMMGAYGGLATGHDQVTAAIDRAAHNYTHWNPEYREEPIAAQTVGDIGYVILRESVTNRTHPHHPPRLRRVTVLYRRENGTWKIFHHHSDPLHHHSDPLHHPTGT